MTLDTAKEARIKTIDGQGFWPLFGYYSNGDVGLKMVKLIMEQWGSDGPTNTTTELHMLEMVVKALVHINLGIHLFPALMQMIIIFIYTFGMRSISVGMLIMS